MQKSKKNGHLKNDVMGKAEDVKDFFSKSKKSDEDHDDSKIQLKSEDAEVLRSIEQKVLQCKIRVADIDLMVSSLETEKESLLNLLRSQNEEFVSSAKKFALKHGIDPDGDPSGDRWNLDTSTMVFEKLK